MATQWDEDEQELVESVPTLIVDVLDGSGAVDERRAKPLEGGGPWSFHIGRAGACDFALPDRQTVSGKHARIGAPRPRAVPTLRARA